MAEDLANAIISAAEKMDSKQDISKAVACLASRSEIIPLYEHYEVKYERNDESEDFEFCSRKSWFTFGSEEKHKDVFAAVAAINRRHINVNGYHSMKPIDDKDLNDTFIGQVVEESIERNELLKRHAEKKIVALFQRK